MPVRILIPGHHDRLLPCNVLNRRLDVRTGWPGGIQQAAHDARPGAGFHIFESGIEVALQPVKMPAQIPHHPGRRDLVPVRAIDLNNDELE
jgi:hypothetical protein